MVFWKRTIPLVIAFVMGVVMMLRYFVPHQSSEDLYALMADWGIIIGGFALFLGVYNLLATHFTKTRRHVRGWGYSAVVLFAAFGTIFLGFMRDIEALISSTSGLKLDIISSLGVWKNVEGGSPFDWVYQHMQIPLSATMFSILAFFIVSAAYRTFRARSVEATILLVTAIIVMLGRVPIGAILGDWLPNLQERIMGIPNLAAKRGILIGVCLGSVATSLRIIFGIERAYLGGTE
jgi:hypothetical protein